MRKLILTVALVAAIPSAFACSTDSAAPTVLPVDVPLRKAHSAAAMRQCWPGHGVMSVNRPRTVAE